MSDALSPKRLLLVTGLSGAGKTTVLKTLEDIGWETVDNFPVRLVGRLLATPPAEGRELADTPLAFGFDSRTRGFEPEKLIAQIKVLQHHPSVQISMLFLDCAGVELERRYAETRRRHPMAQDRPAADGIAQERNVMEPLRRWSDTVIDTTGLTASELRTLVREQFAMQKPTGTTLSVTSFGFSRGVPHNADLIFDMRFLRNPHWVDELRPLTGMDAKVCEYVVSDSAYDTATRKILDLLLFLLPRYETEGKAYVNVAFGCTGGRHRSVCVAEHMAQWLRDEGYAPTVTHRNLASRPVDALENLPASDKARDTAKANAS